MPDFTQWNVPTPFTNVLFNPMAVDKAIAESQSELGNLDINRQKLGIEQAKLDAIRAGNSVWTNPDTTGATGTTGAIPADSTPFEQKMGLSEGGRSATQVNKEGYAGQYQFGSERLADLGLYKPAPGEGRNGWKGTFNIAPYNVSTLQDFLGNPAAQHAAFVAHVADIDKVIDATPGADKFDRNGLRAVAHLGGNGGMQSFVASGGNLNRHDSNGTSLKAYYQKFADGGPTALQTAFGAPHGPGGPPSDTPAVQPAGGPPPLAGPRVAADPNAPVAVLPQAATATMPPADLTTGNPNRQVQIPPVQTSQADVPVPVAPSPTAARTGGTDVAGPGAGTDMVPIPNPHPFYQTGLPGVTIGLPTNGMAPPGATAAPVTTAAAPTAAPAPAQGKPPVPVPPPAPSRAIDLAPTIVGGQYDGLTPNQAKAAYSMGLSLVPTQEIAARVETWRQQNLANKQTATSNLAAQQQADFDRHKFYLEQLEKTGWEQQSDGSVKNRYTGEVKWPPSPRFGPQVVGPDGKVSVPALGGAGGTQYFQVPDRPADAGYKAREKAYTEEMPQITQAAEHAQNARTSQIRWQTMFDLTDKLSTGAGGATRAQLANLAETAGLSGVAQTLIAHTSDGDAAAAQEFTKLATQAAGADARADLGSRAGLGAIKLFQSANPNVDLRPGANKAIIGMQLIAAQADADYNTEKLKFGNKQQDAFFKDGSYQPLNRFEEDWQTKRNPQVYAAAMGALTGLPPEKWTKGLSDDEYKRALDVVSRASPSATVNAKSGPISMQPQAGQGQTPSSAAAPTTNAPAPPPPPAVGAVQGGYRFKGGNPASPTSWEAVH